MPPIIVPRDATDATEFLPQTDKTDVDLPTFSANITPNETKRDLLESPNLKKVMIGK